MSAQNVSRSFVWLLVFLLASCTATPTALTHAATPLPTQPVATSTTPHAPEIRFGLVGDVTGANVWALFDSQGYSYNNYAVHSAYWPRLYRLSIPGGQFEPQAAAGMPSPVGPEGPFFSATVPLRSDLTWTDGSPFTADDVAFTVNTAVGFQLGFDWRAYYEPQWLDHAAAIDSHTVKFYFKRAPNVSVWQYGALQGPVVQKSYWDAKVAGAAALLPVPTLISQIDYLKGQVVQAQKRVDDLVRQGITAPPDQVRQLQAQLLKQQGDLDHDNNDLAKAEASIGASMEAARQALYALDAQGEPTLGTWLPAGEQNGIWVNQDNPSHPFGSPNFDRATYALYADQSAAIAALEQGQIDAILDPHGVSPGLASQLASQDKLLRNSTSSAYFLVINPARAALADPAFRLALFCSINPALLPGSGLTALPLSSFVLADNFYWSKADALPSCGAGYDPLKSFDPHKAAAILKAAGYTWTSEPAGEQAGLGLKTPDGQPFAPIALLAPSEAADPQSSKAALFVEQSVRYLGIPLSVQSVDPSDIRFALFKDGGYDLALAAWRLSVYPGYLCDWFGDGNAFGYSQDQVRAACQALESTSDLDTARQQLGQVQSVLAQDLPFIPLYSGLTYDVYRGIHYPFEGVLSGLSGIYGAPELALPGAP